MLSKCLMLNVDIVILFYRKNRNYLHLQQVLHQGRVQARHAPLPSWGGSGTGQAGVAESLFQGSIPVPRQPWSVGCTARFRLCHRCSLIFQGAARSFVSLPYPLSQKDIKCRSVCSPGMLANKVFSSWLPVPAS